MPNATVPEQGLEKLVFPYLFSERHSKLNQAFTYQGVYTTRGGGEGGRGRGGTLSSFILLMANCRLEREEGLKRPRNIGIRNDI